MVDATDPQAIPDPQVAIQVAVQALTVSRDALVSQLGDHPPFHAATKRLWQQIAAVDADTRQVLMPSF
jgi:hypothetical protein